MYIYLSLLVCIVGLLMHLFVDGARYPKAVEIGKIMFWTGLLAFLLQASNAHLGIISR